MPVLPNSTKRTLKAGGAAIGTMITFTRSPAIARMAATAGFQWVVMDTEHGAFSTETQTDFCLVARGAGITPVIRVPGTLPTQLALPLDFGAQGLMIPDIEDRAEVEHIVRETKYAPQGMRGLQARNAHTDFARGRPDETLPAVNEETLILIQIESGRAVECIDELVSVPGIDAAFVGPNDLSQSLGVPGQVNHPLVKEAIHKVIAACQRHGVAPGLHCYDVENACYWLGEGIRLMLYCNDVSFFVDTGAKAMSELNAFLKR